MKRILFILSVIILSGCKQSLDHYLTPNFKQKHLNSASLLFKDTIKIPVPQESMDSYFMHTDLLEDRFIYGFGMYSPLSMSVFDLNKKEFLNLVNFDRHLLNAMQIVNFKVISPDSIILTTNFNSSIFFVDRKGQIIDRWTGESLNISETEDVYIAEIGCSISSNSRLENLSYDKSSNLLYIPLGVDNILSLDYVNAKRHGVYNLSQKKWQVLYGAYEGTLKHTNKGRYFYDMEYSYQLITPDYIYISYPVDHSVYIYDKTTFKLKEVKDISPSMATKTPAPLYDLDVEDDRKLNNLRRAAPFYGPLYYHESINKFSRFYNEAKKENRPAQRAIIIYDSDFNILEERAFPIQQISHIQPSPAGFIIQPYQMESDTAIFVRVDIIDKL